MLNIHILFLDDEGFPVGEAETGEGRAKIPDGAVSARLELPAGGFTLVRVEDAKAYGKKAEAIPQNAAGISDGDLFSFTCPRYLIQWDGKRAYNGGELSFRLHAGPIDPEQVPAALLDALNTRWLEMEDMRLELEQMRGAFADIYQSRSWRLVRVYYGIKDFIKKIPLITKPLKRIASLFGVRARATPFTAEAGAVREVETLFRREERQTYKLSDCPAGDIAPLRVAVHLHLFYRDMAPYFMERLSHIPVPFDLYISVTEDPGELQALFGELANAASVTVEAVENRGRDVMPMIQVFGKRLAGYDVFLHIHSKKSPHSGVLAGWRDYLADNLLARHTEKILGLFGNHPELGILYPEPIDAFPYWTLTNGVNFDGMARLFAMLALPFPAGERYPDFPVGTMFWARGAALAPLLTSSVQGFPEESGQTDGTLAHAVERSLCLVASHQGYRPAQINAAKDRVSIGPGLKNLHEYITLDAARAAKYLQTFKYAAFGLFGALAVPGLPPGRALWERMEAFDGFPALRAEAEAAARHNNGAPDIHNVYAELRRLAGLSIDECRRLKDLEFRTLLESCRARTAVVKLLNGLTEKGADAVIAEDTVWPEAYLRKILKLCGVRGDIEIYTSAGTGRTKKDGSLYDFLKSRFRGQSFVSVGGDEVTDIHIPNTRRVHHLHVMHPDTMASVIGLAEPTPRQRDRMIEDPFCLLELMRELQPSSPHKAHKRHKDRGR